MFFSSLFRESCRCLLAFLRTSLPPSSTRISVNIYQNTQHHIPEDTIVELAKEFSWAVGIRVVRREGLSK
jgi:hypothetical protein